MNLKLNLVIADLSFPVVHARILGEALSEVYIAAVNQIGLVSDAQVVSWLTGKVVRACEPTRAAIGVYRRSWRHTALTVAALLGSDRATQSLAEVDVLSDRCEYLLRYCRGYCFDIAEMTRSGEYLLAWDVRNETLRTVIEYAQACLCTGAALNDEDVTR